MSVSGFLERKAAFEGALIDAIRISPVNAYRPIAGATPETLAEVAALELEEAILSHGAETIAGFIFEPVVGAAGGCVPAPEGYARRVRDICSRHGVLMIADEVMCGAGRCGTWRALEKDGAEPDIMSVAKGLAAGYLPLGATVYSRRVSEAIQHQPMTAHTFTAHTACCAAGVAVQKIVTREKLVERVAANETKLRQMMVDALAGVEAVGDIRGRGYFQAVELVRDRGSKQPFPAAMKLFQQVRLQAFENGLICYPVGGNVDGVNGDIIIISPPCNATDAELSEICDKLGQSVRQVLGRI